MVWSRLGPVLLAAGIMVTLFSPLASPSRPADIELLDVDTYRKTVDEGGTASYTWTVRVIQNLSTNYSVRAAAASPGNGWRVEVEPESFPSIAYPDARQVWVNVTSTDAAASTRSNITVTFTVYQDGALIAFEKRNAVTTVSVPPPVTREKWFFNRAPNFLPPPLDGDEGVFLLDVLLWLGLSLPAVLFILPRLIRHRKRRKRTDKELDEKTVAERAIVDRVLSLVWRLSAILIFAHGVISSTTHLRKYLSAYIIDFLTRIYWFVFWLVVLYLFWRILKDIVIVYAKKVAAKTETKVDDILVPIVEKIGLVMIVIAAIFYLLGYIGLDLSVFVAGGVVVSMVIAFAAQETLSNFFSGFFILTDRPFKEGDSIILDDNEEYWATKIGIRSTRLIRKRDGAFITIPNTKLGGTKIVNLSTDKASISFSVGVAYGTEPERVREIVYEAIESCGQILQDDPDLQPAVFFQKFGESSIDFFIRVWIKNRDAWKEVNDYLHTRLYKRFAEEGIEIPLPQRVVHFKPDKVPQEVPPAAPPASIFEMPKVVKKPKERGGEGDGTA